MSPHRLVLSCEVLKGNKAKANRCAVAREAINNQCFDGGDQGHIKAASDARKAESFCDAKLKQKPCN